MTIISAASVLLHPLPSPRIITTHPPKRPFNRDVCIYPGDWWWRRRTVTINFCVPYCRFKFVDFYIPIHKYKPVYIYRERDRMCSAIQALSAKTVSRPQYGNEFVKCTAGSCFKMENKHFQKKIIKYYQSTGIIKYRRKCQVSLK